jgi:hypothetical protein
MVSRPAVVARRRSHTGYNKPDILVFHAGSIATDPLKYPAVSAKFRVARGLSGPDRFRSID